MTIAEIVHMFARNNDTLHHGTGPGHAPIMDTVPGPLDDLTTDEWPTWAHLGPDMEQCTVSIGDTMAAIWDDHIRAWNRPDIMSVVMLPRVSRVSGVPVEAHIMANTADSMEHLDPWASTDGWPGPVMGWSAYVSPFMTYPEMRNAMLLAQDAELPLDPPVAALR